jgi:alkanesulfonate monooxygenase SsuD/methylene tetrahydromethanopterin reductase-like flavin-dependent oxidoreductase (luciferase family)
VTEDGRLHLAVALDGAGWHPAAWREPSARPTELFRAGYWVELARLAEGALLDLVTIEDSLALQSGRQTSPDRPSDLVTGRLDAVLVAARVAPLTRRIGLVPSVTVTHTEPFHVSKAIATLDYVSSGRAGVRVQVSARPHEAAHFGRRTFPVAEAPIIESPIIESPIIDSTDDLAAQTSLVEALLEEAGDYVEVLRRLWDSWEDDAEIRDIGSGRFIDRAKLHYIDFSGQWFSVKGPSITPRPPQGQPLVTALAHSTWPLRFATRRADVVFTTPHDARDAGRIAAELADLHAEVRRHEAGVTWLADLVVFLGSTRAEARDRKLRLDEMLGRPYRSDAAVFVGTATELADLMQDWLGTGLDGFRLRPGGLPHDLRLIGDELVPELQRRLLFRTTYDSGTLRARFGLSRPASRYTRLRLDA